VEEGDEEEGTEKMLAKLFMKGYHYIII